MKHLSDPSVLKLWLRVAKPGALISFTHKTSVWPEWEKEQDEMEESALWKKLWISEPIPYLPSLKEDDTEPCEEMAKVYIYQKLWCFRFISYTFFFIVMTYVFWSPNTFLL